MQSFLALRDKLRTDLDGQEASFWIGGTDIMDEGVSVI